VRPNPQQAAAYEAAMAGQKRTRKHPFSRHRETGQILPTFLVEASNLKGYEPIKGKPVPAADG
jgi:hypothetical protein